MDNKKITLELTKKLKELDPDISGVVHVHKIKNNYKIVGELETSKRKLNDRIQSFLMEILSDIGVSVGLLHMEIKYSKPSLTVTSSLGDEDTVVTDLQTFGKELYEILYQGMMPLTAIEPTDSYKRLHQDNLDRVRNAIRVTEFIAPIVIDETFKIIDGNLRYSIAKSEEFKEVPVIVVKADKNVQDFIRLTMNRSSEFQRWKYAEVDSFVDAHPLLQPALEPLGFFSTNILPASFFTNTVLEYEVADFESQQQAYRQEVGLAEWAKIQRAKRDKELKRKERARKKRDEEKAKTDKRRMSLFDAVEPEHFLPTTDVNQSRADSIDDMKEQAELVTETYDIHRKEIIEERGGKWQNDRRSAKEVFNAKKEEHSKLTKASNEAPAEEKTEDDE